MRAREGGLLRLADAVNLADPRAGLDRVIEIFCDFWSFDPSVGRLHLVADAEFKGAVDERNERRRKVIGTLVRRIEGFAEDGATRDLVDTLFVLTSYAMFSMFLVNGRSAADVRVLIKAICDRAITCALGAANAQTQ
jgi:hypothetical protein